uniref:Uncharacterized protein n=1 Tax=Rhizophora mucronata TaxID=61149 RepID=A0A2P2PU76_RHIMU
MVCMRRCGCHYLLFVHIRGEVGLGIHDRCCGQG